MNKKIRELAEQAQDWADAHAPFASEEHVYFAEKFAQLIVRECLSIIERRKRWIDNENGNTDNLWTHGYEKAINHCSMFIKEYFGVEE